MKKSTSIFKLLLTATIFLSLSACKKGGMEKQADPSLSTSKKGSTLSTLTVPDVYVAGNEGSQAKYWKNGVGVTLTGGFQANGIFIDGTDVYCSGYGFDPVTFNLVALYWKNGVLTTLSDGTDNVLATGITVSGGDVYVTGRVGMFGGSSVYWLNGVETSLGSGEAFGIFAAANGDIYIPNAEWGNPSYWLNGTLQTLSGGSNDIVQAIAVNGSDVFVVGVNSSGPNETALIWQNGTRSTLSTASKSNAKGVAVNSFGLPLAAGISGTNLNNMQISYWDAVLDRNVLASGQYVATNTGIAIDLLTDDIYVCGSEFNSASTPPARAKYWKISSGSPTVVPLSSGSSDATALAIALGY